VGALKRKYESGKETRQKFERTMAILFRAPKPVSIPKKSTKAEKKGNGE
jgi:hypothetical protein